MKEIEVYEMSNFVYAGIKEGRPLQHIQNELGVDNDYMFMLLDYLIFKKRLKI